ncbi:hypothetical protein Tco_1411693 [Tanacetum coccineum]
MAFVSSNNSGNTNEAVNNAHGVSPASTQANAANPINVDNFSDALIFQGGVLQLPQEETFCQGIVSCMRKDQQIMALMPRLISNSDSEVSNDSTCSKSCLETIEVLKSQYEQLLKRFEKSELMVVAYKTVYSSAEKDYEFF